MVLDLVEPKPAVTDVPEPKLDRAEFGRAWAKLIGVYVVRLEQLRSVARELDGERNG